WEHPPLAVGTYTASGNSLLAVGMPYAFYSQHKPRLQAVFIQIRLTGYYQRFIDNFSKIAKPLTLLTQKNKTYVWGDKQEEAFSILKEKLFNALVLALPDGPNDFVVYCDASNQGKENIVADALSRKERFKPRRVRAMSMIVHFGLKAKILEAQSEASKDLKASA
nr:putative reverse transcriptase domain-containing protein [Tanacetum cinerariifolium]